MSERKPHNLEFVAGNGLLHRRLFLTRGAAALGTGSLGLLTAARAQEPPPWMRIPGAPMTGHGGRARYEDHVQRLTMSAPGTDGSGGSRTPIEALEGMITPSGLHFERHHSGVPDIDPDAHRLLVHGLVDRALFFDMDALSRYPMVSRIQFIECSGNSRLAGLAQEPVSGTCGELHGLISCSEWTGVPLSVLLDEAGLDPSAHWILAEGADAAAMTRSVPLAKAMDDALVAIYQNGERLRPENGYPIRLFLPGYEGNMSVKWLRRIKVTAAPMMTREETSKYTDLLPDGRSLMFTFPMDVKSVITSPSPGLELAGSRALPGFRHGVVGAGPHHAGRGFRRRRHELGRSGAVRTGAGQGGDPVPHGLALERRAGRDHEPGRGRTRAVQPTRASIISAKGTNFMYHYNGIQAWRVDADGQVANVHV